MRLRGRLFVLVVLALAFAGVGLALWHLHRAEQTEQARITAIGRYKLRIAAATERLVRIRGERGGKAVGKAVDDVLLVIAVTGVSEEVAIRLLEVVAEDWPTMAADKKEGFRKTPEEVRALAGTPIPDDLAAKVAARPDLAFVVEAAMVTWAYPVPPARHR